MMMPRLMPLIFSNAYLHGALTFALFLVVSILTADMAIGFFLALILSGISSWFRPCYSQFVFGAMLALTLFGLLSLLVIEGSAAIVMFPLVAIVSATALLSGWLIARVLQWIFLRGQ